MFDALFSNAYILLWSVLMLVFLIAEALSVALISVWFAVGAVLAIVSAIFGAPFWLQLLIFVAVSGILVLAAKPLSEKMINRRAVQTNADRVLGRTAVVTQTVDNLLSTGQVRVLEQLWTARSADGKPIAVGTTVRVKEIQGVKVIVEATETEKEDAL